MQSAWTLQDKSGALRPVLVSSSAVSMQQLRDAPVGSQSKPPSWLHLQSTVESWCGSNSVFILLLHVGIDVPGEIDVAGDGGRSSGSGFSPVSCTLTLGW